MAQWFLLQDDNVRGPLTTEQVKSEIREGKTQSSTLIWSRLQDHWRTLSWWQAELPNLLQRDGEKRDNRLWHYAADGASFGPFTRSQLTKELGNVRDKNEVLLWTKGMPNWGHIYEFPDVMDEIGVSRRQHPRAKITGSVVVKTQTQTYVGQMSMISAGGCGITGVTQVLPGERVNLDIKCSSFPEPVRTKAEVRYVTENGFVGLKFEQISTEAQARIIEYVRNTNATGSPAKAAA